MKTAASTTITWERYIHEDSGKSYFYNTADRTTQWEVPSSPTDHITWFPPVAPAQTQTQNNEPADTEYRPAQDWCVAARKNSLIVELRNSFTA